MNSTPRKIERRKNERKGREAAAVTLTLPKTLAKELRAKKPEGQTLRGWLVGFLWEVLREDSTGATGKKRKACCGKAR